MRALAASATRVIAALARRLRATPIGGSPARLLLAGLLVLSASALAPAPALAAVPETPETLPPTEVKATTALLHGLLDPLKEGVPGTFELGFYEFVYRQSPSECQGVGEIKTLQAMSVGGGREEVSQAIEALTAGTRYTVCLIAHDESKTGESVSPPVTFTTATPPEAPVTEPAAEITPTTATLHGQINPGGPASTGYRFDYSTGGGCEGSSTEPVAPASVEKLEVQAHVSELEGSSEYTFCAVAFNEAGETAQGAPLSFRTPPAKPVITGESAGAITAQDATLEAHVNPENRAVIYRFQYAPSEAALLAEEGSTVGESTLAPASEAQTVGPVDLAGSLTPESTYYYRVIAINSNGTTTGSPHSFQTTAAQPPQIDSESVSGVTRDTAQLHAQINPEFQETRYQFRLGTDTGYSLGGALIEEGTLPAGYGDQEATVSLAPGAEGIAVELQPNTEYHWEASAANATGSVEGLTSAPGDESFLTLPEAPGASTGPASAVQASSATLTGTVAPVAIGHEANDATVYYFEYGTTSGYGHRTAATPTGQAESPPPAAHLAGLSPGTTYHYRIVASDLNDAGELNETHAEEYGGNLKPQLSYGEDETFPTPATPPVLSGVAASGVT